MRKLVYLIIALTVLILSVSLGNTAAQEPTEESPSIVVVDEGETEPITAPPGGVVVVPTESKGQNAGWLTTLSMIISGIVALSAIGANYLNTAQRQKLLDIGEVAESATWNVALGTSQIITALGGRPDIAISDDPAVLAKALRDGNVNVFIRSGADVKAIIEAYNNTSPGLG